MMILLVVVVLTICSVAALASEGRDAHESSSIGRSGVGPDLASLTENLDN